MHTTAQPTQYCKLTRHRLQGGAAADYTAILTTHKLTYKDSDMYTTMIRYTINGVTRAETSAQPPESLQEMIEYDNPSCKVIECRRVSVTEWNKENPFDQIAL